MPTIICPRDGRPLTWNMEDERLDEINVFTSRFQTSQTFKSVPIPKDRIFKQIAIWNQGRLGSCQGQAIAKLVAALYFFATGKWVPLSALKAYIDTQKIDGLLGADWGSTIAGGIQMAQTGLSTEDACPYRDTYPTQPEIKRILAIATEARFAVKSGLRVMSHQHLKELTAGLMPASIGTYWPFVIDNDWVVRRWQRIANGGGHARVFVGSFKNSLPGEDNSWGDWGDDGRFWWEEAAFNACLRDPSTVCTAVSELAEPVARWLDIAKELWGG